MPTDSQMLKSILSELENIGFLMGDVNAIRNGDYDPPTGADPAKKGRAKPKTMDDLFGALDGIQAESMRQTELLESILDALTGAEDD